MATNTTIGKRVKSWLRSGIYYSGMYGLFHQIRNKATLTTFMFHRVLPIDSPAYQNAEKEFTFSIQGFAACLDFIQKHYSVISLTDLALHENGSAPLPSNAALISFDDGWLDTLQYAYPELQRRKLPAVVFVATELMDESHACWWQDALVRVMADQEKFQHLIQDLAPGYFPDSDSNVQNGRRLTAYIAAMKPLERLTVLQKYLGGHTLGMQMFSKQDLAEVSRDILEVGAHGHTHAPLTAASNPQQELSDSYQCVSELAPVIQTMSFPHGAYDANLLSAAHAAGFSFVFTSDPVLAATHSLKLPQAIGRIHIPENEWTCDQHGISFPLLATFLFSRPISD